MDFVIRQAVKEDCPRMMELIKELAIYEKAPDAVTVDFNHFVQSGFGPNPVWWAYVAEASVAPISATPSPVGEGRGEVVGFALYYIRYSTWKGQRMYLEDLIVTNKMRGQGIGKLLLDRLVQECKEKNYSGMMWQVLDWNEPAINFYKKYGNVNFDGEWVNCSIEIK
ncbi:MAG: GNAT family N-acetyltransferase [Chitinophagaceae bacterium]|nr:GNAT family N-acetyltransferase [Chitinophagaceae bacterium]